MCLIFNVQWEKRMTRLVVCCLSQVLHLIMTTCYGHASPVVLMMLTMLYPRRCHLAKLVTVTIVHQLAHVFWSVLYWAFIILFCTHRNSHMFLIINDVLIDLHTNVITRDHSFPQNAEFWAEPQNLAVSAEFLCFCGIWYWPVITGQIRHNFVGFRCPYKLFATCRHDCTIKYMTATRALSDLIWNFGSLFGRQAVVGQ